GHKPGSSLHAGRDARGRSGGDHVARCERARLVDDLDDVVAVEDQVCGVRALSQLAVNVRAQVEVVRIADLFRRDEVWPDRSVGVKGLSDRPLVSHQLPVAYGEVVDDDIARDHSGGIAGANVTAASANDDSKLALIVEAV